MTNKTSPPTSAASRPNGEWRGPVLIAAIRIMSLSALVGGILTLFGVRPIDIAVFVGRLWRTTTDLGFGAVGAAVKIVLLGAVIVVPLYLLRSVLRWLIRTKLQL